MSIYKGASKVIDLPNNTVVELRLPQGSKEHLLRVSGSAWQFSFDSALLTTADGMDMNSGEAYSIESPVVDEVLYVKQTSGSPQKLKWAYLYPSVR